MPERGEEGGSKIRFRVRSGDRGALLAESELVIGRSAYCTLILEHETISRVHASLRIVGDSVELTDNKSSNGTYVNGEAITRPTLVGPGDDIRLGRVKIWLEVASMKILVDTGQFAAVHHPTEPDDLNQTGVYERDS
jgi:pSer/pThr/pTyr-binding forkhead associated (FHA) protein